MKWEINFDELIDVKYDLEDSGDFLDEFVTNYVRLVEIVTTLNEGEFFKEIQGKFDTELPDLKKVLEECEDLRNSLDKYIVGIEDSDYWISTGTYKVNNETVRKQVERLQKLLLENFKKISNNYKNFEEKQNRNINEFYNVNSFINIDSEYADKEDIRDYITNRQNYIEDDISNFNYNCRIIEEAKTKIEKLEYELDELV